MTKEELIKKYEGMLNSASAFMRPYYLNLLKDLKALDEPKHESQREGEQTTNETNN